jgi:hypothetical protein
MARADGSWASAATLQHLDPVAQRVGGGRSRLGALFRAPRLLMLSVGCDTGRRRQIALPATEFDQAIARLRT